MCMPLETFYIFKSVQKKNKISWYSMLNIKVKYLLDLPLDVILVT